MPQKNHDSFIPRLISMIKTHPHAINWNKQGTQIEIIDLRGFREEVLPLYFPKMGYSAFMRQLSMFGFSKHTTRRNTLALRHHHFHRGNQSMVRNCPYRHKKLKKTISQRSGGEEKKLSQKQQSEEISIQEVIIRLPTIPQIDIYNSFLALVYEINNKGKGKLLQLAQIVSKSLSQDKISQQVLPSYVSFGWNACLGHSSEGDLDLPRQQSLPFLYEDPPLQDTVLI